MTAGTISLEQMAPTGRSAVARDEKQGAGAPPKDAGVVLAPRSGSLPNSPGAQPQPAVARQAGEAARAGAARLSGTAGGGSAPSVAARPGRASAAGGPNWRGLSVAEAAAAARISFRPLRRPFGRLPYGAPWHNLDPLVAMPLASDPPRAEPLDTSVPAQAGAPARVARTIEALEKLRRAVRLQGEQPQVLAEARA